MTERILVSVAWPYANGSIHIGQVAGCYLPADIFARYHRMNGNEVLMVSGADAHGTPVTLTAEQRGTSPDQVSSGYQAEFLDNWARLGISFDLFTSTHTDNHTAVVQEMFLTLLNNGYIYKDHDDAAVLRDRQPVPRRQVRTRGPAPTAGSMARAETSAIAAGGSWTRRT